MKKPLTDEERLDWLQLIRTPHIGPITFYKLVKKFGTAANALELLPEFSRRSGRKNPLIPSSRSAAEAEIKHASRQGVIVLAACEPEYPEPLCAIADPPPILFGRGHTSLFEKPAIAIVGARNASGIGRKLARQLASDLGHAGLIIVSGLARGIDGAAHTSALETGTIAVVAGGVDYIYPPEHGELTNMIANQGMILSERPLGTEPTARDFPRRNRLISGLSRGVVIVEAAVKSGTLITARFAHEHGREVFAIPGSPLDPRAQGANKLIQDNEAMLITGADDILEVLASQNRTVREGDPFDTHGDDLFGRLEEQSPTEANLAIDDEKIALDIQCEVLNLLGFSPLHQDEILRESNAPPGLLADALLMLLMAGKIEESGGGTFVRASFDDTK